MIIKKRDFSGEIFVNIAPTTEYVIQRYDWDCDKAGIYFIVQGLEYNLVDSMDFDIGVPYSDSFGNCADKLLQDIYAKLCATMSEQQSVIDFNQLAEDVFNDVHRQYWAENGWIKPDESLFI